jgi:hypothetical protein
MTTNQRSKTTAATSGTETARRIADLVNSKSTTPSVTEIERVLGASSRPTGAGSVTISAITQAICEAHDLCGHMDDGEWDCKQVCGKLKEDADAAPERERQAKREQWLGTTRLASDFEGVGTAAVSRINGMHAAMLCLEPATPSEVLSLAIMTREALEHFVGDHISRHHDRAVERETETIDRALDAVIRGLVHVIGVESPLVERYVVGGRLTPRHEEHARLLEQLPRLKAQRDALDAGSPIEGRKA